MIFFVKFQADFCNICQNYNKILLIIILRGISLSALGAVRPLFRAFWTEGAKRTKGRMEQSGSLKDPTWPHGTGNALEKKSLISDFNKS